MNPDVLEKVLACQQLPSLPAVAVRVLELTQNRNVNIRDLAEAIHNDQALAAKVLRTVNSSFYGLRQRCSNINQAIVMLGLSAVKTLALGFSLVSTLSESKTDGFDLIAYWRRGILTGVGAKIVSRHAKLPLEEEAFLGGLLQDVGMIAMYQALGAEYAAVVRATNGNHRDLLRAEQSALELTHPMVGAMLASRWKLPAELLLPIKYHERPSAAPTSHTGIVRAVALGNILADILSSDDPAPHLRRFYTRAEDWFGLSQAAADEIVKATGVAGNEIARLLDLDAGDRVDGEGILAKARERLLAVDDEPDRSAATASPELSGNDELTGALSRRRFDQSLVVAFEQAQAGGRPFSLAIFQIDGLDTLATEYSTAVRDAVLTAVTQRLDNVFRPLCACVYRYSEDHLAVLMRGTGRVSATRAAETARRHIQSDPLVFPPGACELASLHATVSIGLACADLATLRRITDPSKLTEIAEQAVAAAHNAGRNTLRIYAPAA